MAHDPPKLDPSEHPYVYSASQIDTALLCLRKWGFQKIDKIVEPDTDATRLGSDTHDHLEKYLRDATPIDTSKHSGKIALELVPHLPPPKAPGMSVEEWFVRKYGSDETYWGKKDWQFLEGYWGLDIPIVGDHKTCSSFTWAKNEDDLQENTQGCMYAWDAMEETGKNIAQLRWNYTRTKGGKKSLPIVANVTRMQAEDVMCQAHDMARVMTLAKQTLSMGEAIELEPDFSACEAFGGCPRKDRCKPTAANVMDALMTQKTTESVLSGLRNRKNKNKTSVPTEEVKEKETRAEEAKAEDAESQDEGDKVNGPDRDKQPPPPPSAKQAGGKWFQPTWNDTEWAWEFAQEYHDAVKAEEDAKKKAEAEAKKKKGGGRTRGSSKKAADTATAGSVDGILEVFAEKLATAIAEKVAEKLKG